ncbi:prepilin peptidase [Staphylococcus americanisciuri]|uniref:Prepilin peptidase n=1 Tax=Staphylococcus americanisciuri TaxID=2973940 RepID=A0ABT2EZK7_9STAP|nr:prepilin peptidase [Staphylococcus americanisciuri]MCS4485645.1 prepilin peptidase [Staphylococcus americanisciuri]
MIVLIIFLIGSALMSFLMHVASAQRLSCDLLYRRSRCQACLHTLAFKDLIPIVSYVKLKGCCRYCKAPIPRNLLIAEVFGGFIAITPVYMTLYLQTTTFYLIAFILLCLAFIDIQRLIILHRFLFILLVVSFFLYTPSMFSASQLYFFIMLFILSCCLHRVIGVGDFKLLMVLSLILPTRFIIFMFWLTFPLCLLFLPVLYTCGVLKLPFIPLVPAIAASFYCVSLWYPTLINLMGGLL